MSCCGVGKLFCRSNEFASRIRRRIELLPKNGQQASIDVESLKHCVTRRVEIVRRDRGSSRAAAKVVGDCDAADCFLHEGHQAAHLHHGDIWQPPGYLQKVLTASKSPPPAGSDPSLATLFLPRGLGKSHRPAQLLPGNSLAQDAGVADPDVMHRPAMKISPGSPLPCFLKSWKLLLRPTCCVTREWTFQKGRLSGLAGTVGE